MAEREISERLLGLVEQLRQLAPDERSMVVRAASMGERCALSWEAVREGIGVVNIGGDALEDCESLYDDV